MATYRSLVNVQAIYYIIIPDKTSLKADREDWRGSGGITTVLRAQDSHRVTQTHTHTLPQTPTVSHRFAQTHTDSYRLRQTRTGSHILTHTFSLTHTEKWGPIRTGGSDSQSHCPPRA